MTHQPMFSSEELQSILDILRNYRNSEACGDWGYEDETDTAIELVLRELPKGT